MDVISFDADVAMHFVHRLRFTEGVFDPQNPTLVRLLECSKRGPAQVLTFIDQGVVETHPALVEQIEQYAVNHPRAMTLAGQTRIVPGGEAIKNDPHGLENLLRAVDEAHLCRQSYVLVVGGGAVLDAVGLVAAMAHRGVRLIRVATTTLSQADSAVGVKNGINAFGKKNYLGVFAPPWAVINDEAMLCTLSDRDWICGFSEAVKVSLFKDVDLFERIAASASALRERDMAVAIPIIRRSAELHYRHITETGDPFELTSARPLDFGHWAAHKLEQMTHNRLRHGEAVAIGLAVDLVYCHLIGYLDEPDMQRMLDCLSELGFALYDPAMRDVHSLMDGLDEFREHLGGQLTIPLIQGVGRPIETHQIDRPLMLAAIDRLAERHRGVEVE